MSRRALGTAALAAGLLATGLLPLLGTASAADCPTWTDTPNDATPNQYPVAAADDPNMDILSTRLATVGGDIVATVTVDDLSDSFTDIGDRFSVQFDAGSAHVRFLADRDAMGKSASIDNLGSAATGAATAVWDAAKDTVTITAKQAELDKAAGASTKGESGKVVASTTGVREGADDLYAYDTSIAPAGMTYVVGAACGDAGPGPSPTPTATPTSPTPSPTTSPGTLPEGYPRAGCNTFTDPKGDGKATAATAAGTPVGTDNDPDLDLTGVAIDTTDTAIKAFLRVDSLSMPKTEGGHIYSIAFTVGTKTVELFAGEGDTAGKAIEPAWGSPNYAEINGTFDDTITVTPLFDRVHNVVGISAPLAQIAKAVALPFANGTKVTAVAAHSMWMWTPLQGTISADTVQATDVADRVYTLGDSPCFGPPPGVLANTGKTTVQYTDAAAVAAKLTNAAGAALAGKAVTFAVGSKSVTATTGSDGVARAALNPGVAAGSYSLVTSFAGDSSADKVSLTTPFTVTAEKTKIVLSVVKSGVNRTVTAKLVDDDGHAVAGQLVTWYVNGKKVSSAKTTSAGTVKLTTAKPTQTVKAVFTTVTGKYTGSTAQAKV